MKTFAIGDIHGAYKALRQCLKRSGFDYACDRLIVLGDVCDGYAQVKECIDELLKIKHCDAIMGNHDCWALDWALTKNAPEIWVSQGGRETIASYNGGPMPQAHIDFLRKAQGWIECGRKLFVHAGIDPQKPLSAHDLEYLTWDRNLVQSAWIAAGENPRYKFSTYDEIYVGHTTTQWLAGPAQTEPLFLCNVIMLDTGAGWSGKLTIMNIDSHEYWQSDSTPLLQGVAGRKDV